MRAENGAAGERIVEICAEEDVALVVVGSRRRGGLKADVLGSTSQHVAGNAPCPCVVVPLRKG
jgi:nucleotide-binding universal stress UspA family protein